MSRRISRWLFPCYSAVLAASTGGNAPTLGAITVFRALLRPPLNLPGLLTHRHIECLQPRGAHPRGSAGGYGFMGLRELKETAHQQFVRGKFAECAATYQRILRLAPRDPNLYVRHAEACRRTGERQQAITSYRAAAGLLLELGSASRARGALKAALELDPKDPLLQLEIAQLESNPDALISSVVSGELPLLPPLESVVEDRLRTPALPPIHRALPSAQHLGPPMMLPPPGVRPDMAGAAVAAQSLPQSQVVPPGYRPLPPRAKAPPPAPRQAMPSGPPPVLYPSPPGPIAQPSSSLPPRSATQGSQAQAARAVAPPPLPAAALAGAVREASLAQLASPSVASGPSQGDVPRLEMRRLSPSTIAFRSSPKDGWAVIRSHTPLELHLVEELEKLPPMMQDLPSEMTVAPEAEGAPAAVH